MDAAATIWGVAVTGAVALALAFRVASKRRRVTRAPSTPVRVPAPAWRMPDPDEEIPVSFRCEAWEPRAGGRAALFMAGAHGACAAYVLHAPACGGELLASRDVLEFAALRSDRDALLEALAPGPALAAQLDIAKLFDEGAAFLEEVENVAVVIANAASNWQAFSGMGGMMTPLADDPYEPATGHLRPGCSRGTQRMADICYLIPDVRRAPAAGSGSPEILQVRDPRRGGLHDEGVRKGLARMMADWHGEAARLARPDGLVRHAWTRETYAFLADGGEAGRRRRQAAALHRAFLPTLARTPSLVAAIDAGRPFEAGLLDVVNGYLGNRGLQPLDMARLRRLRAYPDVPTCTVGADLTGDGLDAVLWAAGSFPIDRVPSTAEGWRRVVPYCTSALAWVHRFSLPLAPVLSGVPPDWGIADLGGQGATEGSRASAEILRAVGLRDMVRRLVETVLAPAGVGPWGAAPAPRVAARMLLAGRTYRAAMRLQEEWHARLDVFDHAMPPEPGKADLVWPALFAPVELQGGIVLRCLTSTVQLREEGSRGIDPAGMQGLSHCVGGYGDRCARGESHIVSVTGLDEEGARHRLSTIELTIGASRRVTVRQHRGERNSDPPRTAKAAEAHLVAALSSGQVGMDPEATLVREPMRVPAEAYDLAAAVAAWIPYLTQEGRVAAARLAAIGVHGPDAAAADRG